MALFGETTAASVRFWTHFLNSFKRNFVTVSSHDHPLYASTSIQYMPIITFLPSNLKLTYTLGIPRAPASVT